MKTAPSETAPQEPVPIIIAYGGELAWVSPAEAERQIGEGLARAATAFDLEIAGADPA